MVVLEHPAIGRIGYVEISGAVHGHAVGRAQRVGADRTAAVGSNERRLAEHRVGIGIARTGFAARGVERRIVLERAVVARVPDVDIAVAVGRDACGLAKAVGPDAAYVVGGRAPAASGGDEAAVLAKHEIGVSIAGAGFAAARVKRRVVFEHAAVAVVGDVEIARRIERRAVWVAQAVGPDAAHIAARGAVIARDGGESAVLAENLAGALSRAHAAAEGRGELEHAVIDGVCNVEITGAVDGDPARFA